MSDIIIRTVATLIVFLMVGGLFLLGRLDPEEENKAIHENKKKAA